MADQTKVDQFKNLTGVDDERAKFYIESAGGNVEVRKNKWPSPFS